MNRSMVGISATLIVIAIGLVSFPLWATGSEQFDLEQEVGILFLPFGLVTMLVGLTAPDPETTTVGGAFGNREFDRRPRTGPRPEPRRRLSYSPVEPIRCPQCRTYVAAELIRCPRCARPRPCRSCGRPLGLVLERPTCPACGRAEPLCNCPSLGRTGSGVPRDRVGTRR
jgi:hypothetical protein